MLMFLDFERSELRSIELLYDSKFILAAIQYKSKNNKIIKI